MGTPAQVYPPQADEEETYPTPTDDFDRSEPKVSPVQAEARIIEFDIMAALGALSIANVLISDANILLARYMKSDRANGGIVGVCQS